MKLKKKITILIIVFILIIVVYLGIKFIGHFINNYDTTVYHSIDEIIEKEYKDKEVEHIKIGKYHYLIKKVDGINSERLIWEKNEKEYMFIDGYHKETRNAMKTSDVIRTSGGVALADIYRHNSKLIILIDVWSNLDQIIKVSDNYGDMNATEVLGDDYYFIVIDESIEDYKLIMKDGQEIVYSITLDAFRR